MIPELMPPKERPPIARKHCRHYEYRRSARGIMFDDGSGPHCNVGCDLSAPKATAACMPPDSQRGAPCPKREEWTEAERKATTEFAAQSMARLVAILPQIPEQGDGGTFTYPVCDGTVSWSRARSNRHVHARCSTRWCFSVMQ